MSNISKYVDTTNLKIVYYLGAGASYNSVPIQEKLGFYMEEVANHISVTISDIAIVHQAKYRRLKSQNVPLIKIAENLRLFGRKAIEYGSLDIYARRLYLLGLNSELNSLKFTLSTFFVLWENFIYKGQKINENTCYTNIDKRYLSLFSVMLEKNDSFPKLNNNVSFITWNYDLQLERAYQSFLNYKSIALETINTGLHFFENTYPGVKNDIIHLNGFSGMFEHEGKPISTINDTKSVDKFEDCLLNLLDNYSDFNKHESRYSSYIKYAWENSKSVKIAEKIMSKADILVIVGYSFPAFNREVDSKLFDLFLKGSGQSQVVFQDPNASDETMESFFGKNNKNIVIKKDVNQFDIPHDFLNPREAERVII